MAYILACGHHVAHQDQPHDCDDLRLHELLDLQPAAQQLRHPDKHLDLFAHRNQTPDRIYVVTLQAKPNANLLLLIEELLDFDETMILWRSMHNRRFFPELWELRTFLWERRGYSAHQPPAESNHLCPALTLVAMPGYQS